MGQVVERVVEAGCGVVVVVVVREVHDHRGLAGTACHGAASVAATRIRAS